MLGGLIDSDAAVAAAPAWTPASLGANLVGWYKADTGVFKDAGITPAGNGDAVQQWNDQSGNGNNLSQAASSNRPTLATTGLNGHPTLTFTVAATGFLINAAFPLGTGTVTSAAMVGSATASTSAFARILTYASGGEKSWIINGATSTIVKGFDGGLQLSGATIVNPTAYSINGIWDGVNYTIYLNNAAGTSDASTFTLTNNQVLTIGAANGGASPFDGNISEVIITKSAMSTIDRNNWWSYVQSKWTLP